MSIPSQEYQHISTSGKPDQCSICFTIFSETDEVVQLVCQHLFHSDCFTQRVNDTEPSCRVSCPECEQATNFRGRNGLDEDDENIDALYATGLFLFCSLI